MKNEEIVAKISHEVSRELALMGIDLIEILFVRGVLKLTIDKPEGVSLDDCVRVTNRIGIFLDAMDIIEGRYRLEVSSPGLNRKLHTLKEYEHFKGKKVKIQMAQNIIKGTLLGTEGAFIKVDTEEKQQLVPFKDIVKANLDY